MELFWLLGAIIFLFAYKAEPGLFRFDYKFYFRFVKTLLIGSAIAIVVNSILGRFPPLPQLGFGSLFLVGWEDLFFSVALIYFPHKYFVPKIAIPLAISASLLFGLGHTYQGSLWAIITCFYPYFFSYKIGKSRGYSTVMAMHVTYDIIIRSIVFALYFLGGKL